MIGRENVYCRYSTSLTNYSITKKSTLRKAVSIEPRKLVASHSNVIFFVERKLSVLVQFRCKIFDQFDCHAPRSATVNVQLVRFVSARCLCLKGKTLNI